VPNLPAVEHPSFYAPQTTFPAFDESNVFRAGSYTIYLILDTRERGGKSREGIRDDLRNNGVLVEVRPLELGDVAWIAKDPATGRECVLDVVLERKRLDDLVGSIKNGRFHEQKVCLS
jgi:crossover junction endonuclease MUS81